MTTTSPVAQLKPFKRIVVPISCAPQVSGGELELSVADLRMFQQALWLAERCHAEMLLVHVVDFVDERVLKAEGALLEEASRMVLPQLSKLQDLARLSDVSASVTVKNGRPHYEILRMAHYFKADLIVMSPRRESVKLGDRIWYGSTSRRIVRRAACPVWFVGPDSGVAVKGALALVDRSPVSENVSAATNLVATIGNAIHGVVHCPDYPHDVALRRLPRAKKMIQTHHRDVQKQARGQIEGWTGGAGSAWKIHFEDDWVVKAAPRLAEEGGYDLLVLANVSHSMLYGVLLGTNAERLMESNPYSTLVVRPDDWAPTMTFDNQPIPRTAESRKLQSLVMRASGTK